MPIEIISTGEDVTWYSRDLGWKGWFGLLIVTAVFVYFAAPYL